MRLIYKQEKRMKASHFHRASFQVMYLRREVLKRMKAIGRNNHLRRLVEKRIKDFQKIMTLVPTNSYALLLRPAPTFASEASHFYTELAHLQHITTSTISTTLTTTVTTTTTTTTICPSMATMATTTTKGTAKKLLTY